MMQQCPKCSIHIQGDKMSMHLWQIHGFLICPLCHESMPSGEIWRHTEACQTKRKLNASDKSGSKKRKMVTEGVFCNECGQIQLVTRRYSKSNKTHVRRCDACKKRNYFKTSEKIDPLDRSVQGGAFEMNRRRH